MKPANSLQNFGDVFPLSLPVLNYRHDLFLYSNCFLPTFSVADCKLMTAIMANTSIVDRKVTIRKMNDTTMLAPQIFSIQG
jgi:hypothetical protein